MGWIVLALVIVWLGFVTFRLLGAVSDARTGVDAMQRVDARSTGKLTSFVDSVGGPDDPTTRAVKKDLATATDAFHSAQSTADSAAVAPLRILPVIGRQIRSISALSSAAADTASASAEAFDQLSRVAAKGSTTPETRMAAVGSTQEILSRLRSATTDLHLGPKRGLISPLADAYDRLDLRLARLRNTVDRAIVGVTGVHRFLQGPSTYLVLASNNAEMRAGSGMYLQAGELEVTDGRFVMSELRPTARMTLKTPGTTVDPDVAALWSWLEPDREWRSLNATPRFDQSARMAADMWVASGQAPVDGVIAMDVVGLQKLLELVGPVDVRDPDGTVTTINADNVLSQLLLKQYLGPDGTDERRDRLSVTAQAVFEAMNQRGYKPGRLLRALQSAGTGRHLLMWSRDPVEQAGWEALETSGALPRNSLLLSVLNRSGNKLDQFLDVAADMTWTTSGDTRRVSVKITATNRAPDGLPRYVGGPYPGLSIVGGEYQGILALTVPKTASTPKAEGAELFLSGEDGPTRLVGTKIDLKRGESTTTTLSFDLPANESTIRVLPSARVPPVTWTAGGATWKDRWPRDVHLGHT